MRLNFSCDVGSPWELKISETTSTKVFAQMTQHTTVWPIVAAGKAVHQSFLMTSWQYQFLVRARIEYDCAVYMHSVGEPILYGALRCVALRVKNAVQGKSSSDRLPVLDTVNHNCMQSRGDL
jgi:hypothetical protein